MSRGGITLRKFEPIKPEKEVISLRLDTRMLQEINDWAMEIDIDYIKAIKEIGNSSIHPNEGDIEKQKEIDQKLLNIVDIIFSELLDKIYEQPNRSKRNLEILYDKMKALNK